MTIHEKPDHGVWQRWRPDDENESTDVIFIVPGLYDPQLLAEERGGLIDKLCALQPQPIVHLSSRSPFNRERVKIHQNDWRAEVESLRTGISGLYSNRKITFVSHSVGSLRTTLVMMDSIVLRQKNNIEIKGHVMVAPMLDNENPNERSQYSRVRKRLLEGESVETLISEKRKTWLQWALNFFNFLSISPAHEYQRLSQRNYQIVSDVSQSDLVRLFAPKWSVKVKVDLLEEYAHALNALLNYPASTRLAIIDSIQDPLAGPCRESILLNMPEPSQHMTIDGHGHFLLFTAPEIVEKAVSEIRKR